jgi:hypothetical protein
MKLGCSGAILSTGFPNEFGEVLTYSRSLKFDQLPDYKAVRGSFASMGYYPDSGPLDWTPCHPKLTTNLIIDEPEVLIPDEEDDDDCDDDLGEDSYCGMDIDIWERQGERDKDVTLPAELDSITPMIVTVN